MDRVNKETRSRVMSAVRSKHTRLEARLLSILLHGNVTGFTLHEKSLPGTPDVVFEQAKTVIFLDSCFWHGCPKHFRRPASNTVYWEAKLESNIKRDRFQRRELRRTGWRVIRVWEHELKSAALVLRKIRLVLESRCG